MKKSTKIQTVIVLAAVVLLLAVITVLLYFNQRVTPNPPGTVGNTAGNLNNGGLFCEYNGTVYFSNSLDNGSLFAMNPDESGVRRLNTLKVGNILAGGKYLYYFQTGPANPTASGLTQMQVMHTFSQCDLNGKNSTTMTTDVVVTGQLVNDYLYLLTTSNTGISFYKIKTDRSDQVELADHAINPACAVDGVIYYSGTETNHYLYSLNTNDDMSREFWRGNLWYPILLDSYIYYLDIANNYRLCRYSPSQDTIEVLTEDRVDCYNVGSGYIYYQKNSATEPQLKCMRTDGSDVQVVAEGNYTRINMTSYYVYFQDYGDNTVTYHVPIGGTYYSTFTPVEQ